ncbi:hypothetical protein EPD60_09735 [Flaviaesturariibacter flavus]|uniref:Outer membrane protein beta-barrel domain-containing protein n=1 Tax=Flaviaesturariibacter flavus TaxID=2502780 RepID=A0A4V2NVP5_9BACT|nr:hypothetical protein [Flaviaesturariibacter flavus]TCJ14272.1 hypothetical protein EPD60_09735 [Flaviaesturariibacter flavus]
MEDFLKSNSERFQMRPSDKVWKGIEDNLKRRRRRMGWFTSLFLLCTSAGAWLLTHPGTPGSGTAAVGTGTTAAAGKNRNGALLSETTFSNQRSVPGSSTRTAREQQNGTAAATGINGSNGSAATDLKLAGTSGTPAAAARSNTTGSFLSTQGAAQRALSATRAGSSNNGPVQAHTSRPGNDTRNSTVTASTEVTSLLTDLALAPDDQYLTEASLEKPVPVSTPALAPLPAIESTPKPEVQKPIAGARRMSLQFFFTPTVSYRSLSENKDYTSSVPRNAVDPNAAALYNINDVVTHKPNIGVELGLSAKVPVSRIVRLQGGVQFNMSRYDVQAFNNAQPQPATMAFIGGGVQTSQTNYTNFEGTSAQKDWLQNMYLQVSAPIGIELKLAGNENTQFGIAGTVQPTYIISDRVYMLSTDYKSYAEVPWLIRRWNLNTAFSTYVGYSTGKLNWQIGPQVRYQLFSSFVSKYPVKENLFDFGLRVGVSLNPKR